MLLNIDRYDKAILAQLQKDGRLSNRDLAECVGLSPTPCWRRVKRLEEEGYIQEYIALVNRQKINLNIIAFAEISMDDHHPDTLKLFHEVVQECPEILECHSVSGQCDYILKIVAHDMESYGQFLNNRLLQVRGIRSVSTLFSLSQPKVTQELPIK